MTAETTDIVRTNELAPADEVVSGCDDIALAVQRALDAYSPELVARVRARIRAYRALGRRQLFAMDLRHIEDDYTEKDVRQVIELLVDLGELGSRELTNSAITHYYSLSVPEAADRT